MTFGSITAPLLAMVGLFITTWGQQQSVAYHIALFTPMAGVMLGYIAGILATHDVTLNREIVNEEKNGTKETHTEN
jgi:cytosine/uracil/thiamine/allantoin permease